MFAKKSSEFDVKIKGFFKISLRLLSRIMQVIYLYTHTWNLSLPQLCQPIFQLNFRFVNIKNILGVVL